MESDSFLVGLVAQICVQKGAEEVNAFLENMKKQYGGVLPKGLKGARFVMMAWENQADDACLDPKYLEGLEAVGKAGLLWEFCCEPRVAPYLPSCAFGENVLKDGSIVGLFVHVFDCINLIGLIFILTYILNIKI
jgi:hypothetical protein